MRRRIMIILLCMCLLAAGAALLCVRTSSAPEENVTRMAELGLVLLDKAEGVSVLAVRDKSPADRAGIQPGDVLLQADDAAFADILQLENMLHAARRHMKLLLRRDQGELITVRLDLQ